MVEIKQEFKDRLKIAMDVRGIKAVDLAKRLGVKEGTISHYRSGYSKPKRERLIEIGRILSVDPAWLMGIDVSMIPIESMDITMNRDARRLSLDIQSAVMLIGRLHEDNRKKVLRYIENVYQMQLADDEVMT